MVNDQVKKSNKIEEKMRNVGITLKTHEEIDGFKEEGELVAVLETDKNCYQHLGMSQETINWKNLQRVTNIQVPLLTVLKDGWAIYRGAIIVTNSLRAKNQVERNPYGKRN